MKYWIFYTSLITNCLAFSRNLKYPGFSYTYRSYLYRCSSAVSLTEYLISSLESRDKTILEVFESISRSTRQIAGDIAMAPLSGLIGSANEENASGDFQKKLDVVSNKKLKTELAKVKGIYALTSEEEDDALYLDLNGRYMISYDPLDGSSNIDCAIPTGTIFGVYDVLTPGYEAGSLLRAGNSIVAAGYCLYSSSLELVISVGEGCQGFTRNPSDGEYYLTRPNIICPNRGPFYSLNEARSPDWPQGLQNYINAIKSGRGSWGKKYSSRYVCSLVADFHRTLLYGGWAGNPRRHLRLLYEAAPLAFLAEQASGKAYDGKVRILDIVPTKLHERVCVFMGSAEDIEELVSYGDVQQLSSQKYEA